MKNTMRCLSIIALAAVIGFLFVTCDNGLQQNQLSGGGGSLSGTYGYTPTGSLTITFRTNNTFTGNFLSSSPVNGTYQIRGNTIVLSQRYYGYNWTIINSNTVMDGDGEYWTRR